MIIDFHTHTFPDRLAPIAVDKLEKAGHCASFTDGTRNGLLASMDDAGIGCSVVLPVVTNPVKAASMNNVSIELTGQDGLIYFGGIHPDTPDAAGELSRIAQAGLKGIKIHPVYQDVNIDDPRYLRILEKAGELGLTVLIHAGADIGFPGVVRCSPQMTANALLQAGPVKLICAHMGGWRNWDEVTDCLGPTSAMVDTAFSLGEFAPLEGDSYYAPQERRMLDEEAFCRLVSALGAGRVIFGSDSPWSSQKKSVEQILALELTDEEKRQILGGNAQTLLGV